MWYWGRSLTVISNDGLATIDIQFDNECPSLAYLNGLSVHSSVRRKGIASKLMKYCIAVCERQGYSFIQLRADKDNKWLVDWYKRLGFVVLKEEQHEYVMLKTLKQHKVERD